MGFRHILFPVDFSARCYGAVPFVKAFAERYQAAITLVHVIEPPIAWVSADGGFMTETDFQQARDDAEERLATFAIGQFPAGSVTRLVEEGDPGACISDLAHRLHADLVMMPTRGRGAVGRKMFGSVTTRALHNCDCAIWTGVHLEGAQTAPAPSARTDLKSILCAIELAPESVSLLKYAKQIGLETGATVHIAHAVPTADVPPERFFDEPLEGFLQDFARDEIAKFQKLARTDFDTYIGFGRVSNVVHEAAEKFNADLIVIGRGVLNRFAGDLRTEAYGIMKEAPCPVISV